MTPIQPEKDSSWRNYQRIRFIKGFYCIRHLVKDLFDNYEKNNDISHEKINTLLETHLRELRKLSDILYRLPDDKTVDRKKQRGFDKVLVELCHELDKTRENIRIIETYEEEIAPEEDKVFKALNRLDKQIYSAAQRDLPTKLRRAKRIIDILAPLFEQILPIYRNNRVVLRTLYFDRSELDKLCKPSTVEYFFPIIYDSTAEGYQELILSLIRTKHLDHAKTALNEFEIWTKQNSQYTELYQATFDEFQKNQ